MVKSPTSNNVSFLARTSPRHFLDGLFTWYDDRYRQAFENILGRSILDISWRQACLYLKHGGFGLTPESFSIGDHDCHRAEIIHGDFQGMRKNIK